MVERALTMNYWRRIYLPNWWPFLGHMAATMKQIRRPACGSDAI